MVTMGVTAIRIVAKRTMIRLIRPIMSLKEFVVPNAKTIMPQGLVFAASAAKEYKIPYAPVVL